MINFKLYCFENIFNSIMSVNLSKEVLMELYLDIV